MRILAFFLLLFLLSCSSTKRSIDQSPKIITTHQDEKQKVPEKAKAKKVAVPFDVKLKESLLRDPFWKNHLVGMVLYDLEKQRNVIDINGDKYFTPASNAKIFTLYTSLKVLNSLEAVIEYSETKDALYFRGTGHPAFLHPHLPDISKDFDFLNSSRKQLIFVDEDFRDDRFNPGWALDDVHLYYQTEKSALPIFGNLAWVSKHKDNKNYQVVPLVMKRFLKPTKESYKHPRRALNDNSIFLSDSIDTDKNVSAEIPFIYEKDLVLEMLSDTFNRKVISGNSDDARAFVGALSYPMNILYKALMIKSDNHVAEQLLLMASYELFDTMNTKKIITHSLDNILKGIPHRPKWVDGSGLSRYNLCTPQSLVWTLEKLNRSLGIDSIQTHFQKISLKEGGPFAYAKTGSLSNNFNLSGYLICKSGKPFAFSFMNNHYMKGRREVFTEVKKVLLEVYEEY